MPERINHSLIPQPDDSSEGVPEGSIRVEKGLNDPLVLKTELGILVCGTDEGIGYKSPNEDAVVINSTKHAFAVVDGMGGAGSEVLRATSCMTEALEDGFEQDASFADIQTQAYEYLRQSRLMREGVVYVAARLTEKNELHIAQAGDVRLIVIGSDGTLKFATEDERITMENDQSERKKEILTNGVRGRDRGETGTTFWLLEPGDRVIVASDGLWDNASSEQVAELVKDADARQAMRILEEHTRTAMRLGKTATTKPDNRSILIYDFTKLKD